MSSYFVHSESDFTTNYTNSEYVYKSFNGYAMEDTLIIKKPSENINKKKCHFTYCDLEDNDLILFHENEYINKETLINYINNINHKKYNECSMCHHNIDMNNILEQIPECDRRILKKKIKDSLEPYNFNNINEKDICYIKSLFMFCPNVLCNKPIEKNNGCDTITCSKCTNQFCYKCGVKKNYINHKCNENLIDLVNLRKLEYNSRYIELNNNCLNDTNKLIREQTEEEENKLRNNDETSEIASNLYPNVEFRRNPFVYDMETYFTDNTAILRRMEIAMLKLELQDMMSKQIIGRYRTSFNVDVNNDIKTKIKNETSITEKQKIKQELFKNINTTEKMNKLEKLSKKNKR